MEIPTRNEYLAGQDIKNSSALLKKIKKLYNINLSKTEYIDLLSLVNFYDFCLKNTVTCYFELLGHFS